MEATLNVRMSAPLKERGDKVLRENGISTSAAVRALWQELVDKRQLPAFLQKETEEQSAKKAKVAALKCLVGAAEGELSLLSDDEIEAVGMARYE